MARGGLAALVVALTALVAAAGARADIVTSTDAEGRTITFDVRTTGVDVEFYAALLRNAGHGDEITRVTIRIVARDQIVPLCAQGAEACYRQNVITVPVGNDDFTAHLIIHEYGHHLDTARPVAGIRELNGTPAWWFGRNVARLLADGQVAQHTLLGWERSVAEIFAEDYSYLYAPNVQYRISWLAPPDETLRAAMLAELGGTLAVPGPVQGPPPTFARLPPVTAPTEAAPPRPVTITRSGRLAPRARRTIPFRLADSGKRVRFAASVAGAKPRVSIEIRCDGTRVAHAALGSGRMARLEKDNLGPARCEASLVSTDTSTRRYFLNLRLS
jgi:hypothetical protein